MDRAEVSLQDILNAVGGPLEEKALWALLLKSCSLLAQELRGHNGKSLLLLITPETVALQRGGSVQFPRGVLDLNSTFQAPEVSIRESHDDTQPTRKQQEKSYVYSLGMTLFTAMQHSLDSSQSPQVSDDMNKVLVAMVEEDDEERISLSGILSLCRKHTTTKEATSEVDKLVSYIMGTEEELSLSEHEDTEELADEANLEMEIKKVMKIPGTGSIEQLYSPTYGSRGSSSLSIHSAAGNLHRNSSFQSQEDSGSADIQLQYSSMPMVYFSSQDRLNRHSRRGSNSDNDSWSSFDRLKPHLQPHEIEILASKARGVQPPPPHTRYTPHFYTPKRARKRGYKDVNRSASFERETLGMYRTSSDGTRRGRPVTNEPLAVKTKESKSGKKRSPSKKTSPPAMEPGVNVLLLDDMPPLPPTTVDADVSTDSPLKVKKTERCSPSPPGVPSTVEKIDSILQSIERRRSDEGVEDAPPSLPPGEPPMLTPSKSQEQPPRPATPNSSHANTSFDYSELGSLPQTPHSLADEDFQFSSQPPIPVSSPPRDEEREHVEESPVAASVQPSRNSELVKEGWKSKTDIDRTITPRRALDEAFKQLDLIGESQLGISGDESESSSDSPRPPRVSKGDVQDEERRPTLEAAQKEDPLYATVDKSKKRRGQERGEEEVTDEEDEEGPPIPPYRAQEPDESSHPGPEPLRIKHTDPGYEEVEFGPKNGSHLSTTVPEEPGYASIQEVMQRPTSGEYSEIRTVVTLEGAREGVRKASSEANVGNVDFAVVHHPKRASMPPEVLSSEKSSDHKQAVETPSDRGAALPAADEKDSKTVNKRDSLHKLQTVFGPEFTKLSGGPPPQHKEATKSSVGRSDSKVKMPKERRLVSVTLLIGKTVQFVVNRDSKCSELFQLVVSHQNLQEKRIFGLAVLRDQDEIFLDLEHKLSKYAPDGWKSTPVPAQGSSAPKPPDFMVFFRVQYYVKDPITDLKLPETRHQLYLQLRKDTVEGKMFYREEAALRLGAFALQADKGDYRPEYQNRSYFRLGEYLPPRFGTNQATKALKELHAKLKGRSKEEAERCFLMEAQKLAEYGMVFYQVSKSKKSPLGEVWLGLCTHGIVAYDVHNEVRTVIFRSAWRKTENISFANRKFIIEPALDANSDPNTPRRKYVYYTQSYKRARYLLHLSISYHRFQHISRSSIDDPDPVPQDSRPAGGGVPQAESGEVRDMEVKILKERGKGLGIQITSGPFVDGQHSSVVINRIERDGPVYMDGKLKEGDILLSADGQSLEGLDHKEVGEILKKSSDLVRLSARRLQTSKSATPLSSPVNINSVIVEIEEDSSFVDQSTPPVKQPLRERTTPVKQPLRESTPPVKVPLRESTTPVKQPLRESTPPVKVPLRESTSPNKVPARELKRATTLELHSTTAATTVFKMSAAENSAIFREQLDVTLKRGDNGSFGLAIATGDFEGVIIYKITPGGSADRAGLRAGDRILFINDIDIQDRTYDRVLRYVQESDDILKMRVSRRSAALSHLPLGNSFSVELSKCRGSLGLRLAGGKNKPIGLGFIYVLSVVDGSPADIQELKANDIVLMIDNKGMEGLTHRDAAAIIGGSKQKVILHIHRPFTSSWVDSSRKAHLASGLKGIVREESSSAIYMSARLPSMAGSPGDLSAIQEDQETPPNTTLSSTASTGTPPVRETDVSLEFPVGDTTPELTKKGVPFQNSPPEKEEHPQLETNVPNNNLLASLSEPDHSPEHATDGLSDSKSETSYMYENEERIVVSLKKGFRGLGFGLNRELSGQPGRGVFVRTVDNDPAKSDGRIQPGDEIIEVNEDGLIDLSHEEALAVLRQTHGTVTLVLRRDISPRNSPLHPAEQETEEPSSPVSPPPAPPEDESLDTITHEPPSFRPLGTLPRGLARPDSTVSMESEPPLPPASPPPRESVTSLDLEAELSLPTGATAEKYSLPSNGEREGARKILSASRGEDDDVSDLDEVRLPSLPSSSDDEEIPDDAEPPLPPLSSLPPESLSSLNADLLAISKPAPLERPVLQSDSESDGGVPHTPTSPLPDDTIPAKQSSSALSSNAEPSEITTGSYEEDENASDFDLPPSPPPSSDDEELSENGDSTPPLPHTPPPEENTPPLPHTLPPEEGPQDTQT